MKKEDLKKKIIEHYNKLNENKKNITDIEKLAVSNEDPAIREFREEFSSAVKKDDDIKIFFEQAKNTEDVEADDYEVMEPDKFEDEIITRALLEGIERKVCSILDSLNLSLYKEKKIDLENVIINDMMDELKEAEMNAKRENVIAKFIIGLVSREFDRLEERKMNRKKTLERDLVGRTLPEIEEFFRKYNFKKLKTMSLVQKKNIIKILIESIDKKYMRKDKEEQKIDNQEYKHLKLSLRDFIIKKYEDIISEKENN